MDKFADTFTLTALPALLTWIPITKAWTSFADNPAVSCVTYDWVFAQVREEDAKDPLFLTAVLNITRKATPMAKMWVNEFI